MTAKHGDPYATAKPHKPYSPTWPPKPNGSAAERLSGLELFEPVSKADDVWVCGAMISCPVVRIGTRLVMGVKSAPTRDIPADVVTTGKPCRVLRGLGRKP